MLCEFVALICVELGARRPVLALPSAAQPSDKHDLDVCVSSLRRGHANLPCIVPMLTDDPRREPYHRITVMPDDSARCDATQRPALLDTRQRGVQPEGGCSGWG